MNSQKGKGKVYKKAKTFIFNSIIGLLPEKSKKESSCVEYGQSKHTKAVVVGLSACILCCFFHSVYLLYT